jgi:hypothetical protein
LLVKNVDNTHRRTALKAYLRETLCRRRGGWGGSVPSNATYLFPSERNNAKWWWRQKKIRFELGKMQPDVIKQNWTLTDLNRPQVGVRFGQRVGRGFLEIYSVSENSKGGRLTSNSDLGRVWSIRRI